MRNNYLILILLFMYSSAFAECIKNIPVSYQTGNGWSQNEIVQVNFMTDSEILTRLPYYVSDPSPAFYATIFLSKGTRIIRFENDKVIDAIFRCEFFMGFNDDYLYGIDNKGYSWRFNIAQIASSNGLNSNDNKLTNNNSSNNTYKSPIDLNEHESTMAAIQEKIDRERDAYNSLSTEEKVSVQKYQNYERQHKWVIREFYNKTYKVSKSISKNQQNLERESKANIKKYGLRRHFSVDNLEDGWHQVIGILEVGNNDLHLKRYIKIENKKIIAFIGGNNLIYNDFNYYKNKGMYKMQISGLGESGELFFYIPEKSLMKSPPKYEIPITLIIKTTSNDKPMLFVFNNKIKYYLGELERYRGESSNSNCSMTEYVIRVPLPPGKYEYAAASDTRFWNNKFKLDNSNTCKIISLSE